MLVVQAGREGWLPRIFGELWSGGRAGWAMRTSVEELWVRGPSHLTDMSPAQLAVLQATLTIAYILLGGGFRSLINFFSVASAGLSPSFALDLS